MNNTVQMSPEELRQRQITKLQTRRYFTISLSSKTIEGGTPFHCTGCGFRITDVYNEPVTMVEIRAQQADLGNVKMHQSFCRKCNIVYLFV